MSKRRPSSFSRSAFAGTSMDAAAPSGALEPPGHNAAPTYAALDLGTNNCRLLIARPVHGAGRSGAPGAPPFVVVDAFSRIVRLGEGLGQTGALSPAAMNRAIEALKVCAGKLRRRNVTVMRHVATEACRRASNCGEFLARVRDETGLVIETITTGEEAALALAGCAPLLDGSAPEALVFDIGGGSTELMWARLQPGGEPELIDYLSLPYGVMNLAESADCDCLSRDAFEALIEQVREKAEAFEARHDICARIAAGQLQMLGTSGTVTTLAGIRMGLPCYDRARVDGCHLDFTELRSVTDHLLALDCKARALEPCIGPARADLVLAGCAILEAICRTWPVGRLRVADRGVREGILLTLMRGAPIAASPRLIPAE
jgi:exopolyphosphatase/guanosine-5'-triphosphate,3'-diphosphate pyrophosphatase